MKRFFIITLALIFSASFAMAQDVAETFTRAQKRQIVESLTTYAQDLNRIKERGETLKTWFYSGFQAGGDNAIIQTISSYVDSDYSDSGSCTGAGGTWSDPDCSFDYDQTSCTDDGYYWIAGYCSNGSYTDESSCTGGGATWTAAVCQYMPDLNGTDFQLMSAGDLSNIIGSMDNLIDTWWATHGVNFLKIMRSAQ